MGEVGALLAKHATPNVTFELAGVLVVVEANSDDVVGVPLVATIDSPVQDLIDFTREVLSQNPVFDSPFQVN